MGQSKILLDSNSYFRLAKDFGPLLNTTFSVDNYCLYVLKEHCQVFITTFKRLTSPVNM